MIYLNNAATSYPKPQCVLDAHAQALALPPAAQYRSAGGSMPFDDCRAAIGELMGVKDSERIFFTSGATEAMNGVLRGFAIQGKRFAVTESEHNCVLRPVYNLFEKPIILPCDKFGHVDMNATRALIDDSICAVVVNHTSNVTGAVQDMAALSEMAHAVGAYMIADVSQSLGALPVRIDEWKVDAAVFTGHKALLGPQGTGGFYLREGINMRPLLFGGTGRDSARLLYDDGNYEYEPGTRNAPGIQALCAGARYVIACGVDSISHRENRIAKLIADGLRELPGVTVYGRPGESGFGSIVSFNVNGFAPADIGYILSGAYGITVRTGMQCAPLICARIGADKGVVRVSPGLFTTEEDAQAFLRAMKEILGANA